MAATGGKPGQSHPGRTRMLARRPPYPPYGAGACYGWVYELATMAGGAAPVMLVIKGIQESQAEMNEPGQGAATGAAGGLLTSGGLFIVERRLPKIDDHQLAVLQAALTAAAARFSARGDGVRYLRSIFLARQERRFSLFLADSLEAVRAVNEAALVPVRQHRAHHRSESGLQSTLMAPSRGEAIERHAVRHRTRLGQYG